MKPVPQRLAQLIKRDLGAVEVGIRDIGERDATSIMHVIAVTIDEVRELVLCFDEAPSEPEAAQRRAEMLVDSFRDLLAEDDAERSPRVPEILLHDELRALAEEAGAVDAVVIDAQSPVVWGDAFAASTTPQVVENVDNVIAMPGVHLELPGEAWRQRDVVRRAVDAVRALPQLGALPKGGAFSHHGQSEGSSFVARSFAGIYVLVVVFGDAVDDLRTERAVAAHLPRIERAVLALPPLEPEPAGGAGAMRRR